MKSFFILTFLALMASALGQNLLSSRHSGYYSYIFRITNSQAREIYRSRNAKWIKKDKYFHTLVDSFPLYSQYNRKLPAGHYLKTSVKGNDVEVSITSVLNLSAQIVNNNTDLCVQLYDSSGTLIRNAGVRIGGRHLTFDDEVKGYLLKKSDRKGILEIEYMGNISFYDLSRNINKSPFRYIESRLFLGTPLKYVWVPVKFIFAAPVITVRDLINGDGYSLGNNLIYFWNRNGISRHYNSYYQNLKKGYFIVNKPKYLPGDTVRFKAFIVSRKGKPEKKELEIEIEKEYNRKIKIGKIEPVRPGSYNGMFVLADSLNLDLDRSYSLNLKKKKNRNYATVNFKYEDYELKNISLNVRTESDTHIRGKEFKIFIKATDENDLNIQDGQVLLTLKSGELTKQFNGNVFVKDTLFTKKIKLVPSGETVIMIPDSVFPAANLGYSMDVKVTRTDNEYKTIEKKISFYDRLPEISYELKADSILFVLKENGKIVRTNATLTETDQQGYSAAARNIILPFEEKINPYFESFKITGGGINKTIVPGEGLSSISCESSIINDSVKVNVSNPRNIPFTWFLYRANKLDSKGYGNNFSYKGKAYHKTRYYLSLIYMWAGSTHSQTFDLSGNKNELKVKVDQPALVYPGQNVKMNITVTDYYDNPVGGVDLTALSYTKKFASDPASPYQFADTRRAKKLINTFRISKKNQRDNFNISLDYDRWEKIFSLDTIEYYKFTHHKQDIYYYSYRPPDQITQFAPFVVKNGDPVRISVIYVDRVPVFFGWIEGHQQPYSFRVDSGYHFVEIRTREKVFKIDSVYFKYGMKLIMSINDAEKPGNFKSYDAKPFFSDFEKSILSRYLFPFRNNFTDNFAYLCQGGNFFLLNEPGNISYNKYQNQERFSNSDAVGPVKADMLNLKVQGSYELSFQNEAGFEYEFFPSIIKMRTIDKEKLLPLYLWGSPVVRFSDAPLSDKRILDSYNEFLFKNKMASAKFDLPKVTLPSYGRLFLDVDSVSYGTSQFPIFIILVQKDPEKSRVYPGNTKVMENIDPGIWSVILYYRGERYFRYDSIPVVAGGRNYSHLKRPGIPVHDSFGTKLNEIIESRVFTDNYMASVDVHNYLNQVKRQLSLTKYSGEGVLVSGTVKDNEGPLPGVNVVVKGTTFGTITDLNGNYSLIVPYENKELVFSFIGYKQVEQPVISEVTDVTLVPDVLALNEVVVAGYSTTVRKSLTGSVSGVSISGPSIKLRGMNSINASNPPLFIIDGVPYDGDLKDLDPAMISNMQVLKDENATSIYGSRAANGVVIISTAGMNLRNSRLRSVFKGAIYDSTFMQQVASSGSLRSNFSDCGYWKPDIVTDRNGKASFEVKFPDDVTKWSTYVLAMNGKKQSGSANGTIKSYKPLMAQLYTPRFLIEGDSTNLIGKILNYTPDSVTVDVSTEINGQLHGTKKADVKNSLIDSIPLHPSDTDTMKIKYYFKRTDGYFDGEERKIPVFRKGLDMTSGKFFILSGDTTVNISNDPLKGEGKLYAQSDRLDLIENEIEYLYVYSYECNEQMASKLIALLSQEELYKFNKKAFHKANQVNRLIRGLEKNQNPDGCWGWWDRSETSTWVTVHVMKALAMAKKTGYRIRINYNSLHDYLIWKLESNTSNSEKLDLLYIMSFTDEKINYPKYISEIDEGALRNLWDKFRLIELKQKKGIAFDIGTILKYENQTLFGNIYFGKESDDKSVCFNEVQTTLAAYRILKSVKGDVYLERIRNFFFERRNLGRWQNTFESSSIIESILPDLRKGSKGETIKSTITFTGSINKTITEFPFELKTKPADSFTITKKGTFPIYFTSYQHYWESNPSADTSYFAIKTDLNDGKGMIKAGKPVIMKVTLRVHKDAQYVMLEIPVPGGCSYELKTGNFEGASHSEFFKDHVAVFYQNLRPGTYYYEISLLPRYTGRYTVNPAEAELMYFPLISSNNALKSLIIK